MRVPAQIQLPVFLMPVAMIVERPCGATLDGEACRTIVAWSFVADGDWLPQATQSSARHTAPNDARHRHRPLSTDFESTTPTCPQVEVLIDEAGCHRASSAVNCESGRGRAAGARALYPITSEAQSHLVVDRT